MSTRCIAVVAVAAALVAAYNLFDSAYTAERTPKMDKPMARVERLFAETKPVCFGRFIIDVPRTALVVWGPSYVGPMMTSYPDDGIRIFAEIRDKVSELKEEKHLREPSSYIGTFDGPNPDSKIVVGYASFESSGRVQLHSYIRLGKHAFVHSAPTLALDDLPGGGDDKTSYTKWLTKMQNVARRLRLREDGEAPADPGVCIEAGFVADGGDFKAEMISIGFRFPEFPDVTFSVQTQKTDRVDETNGLEWSLKKGKERAGVLGKALWYARIKTLREGKRRMGDWEGGEFLGRKPSEQSGAPSVHEFLFQSAGAAKDGLRPIIDMDLHTGVEKNAQGVNEPSLKDDEAVALWDKLTTSIRARPTRIEAGPSGITPVPAPETPPTEKSSAAPVEPLRFATPTVAIGTSLASGTRCPQAGVWTCGEPTALGGTQRAFTAGETLPSIVVPAARTILQKLTGGAKYVVQKGVWTLVELDETKKTSK